MAPVVRDVSVKEFAEFYGTTSQRIYQLIQDGMPHRKRGKKADTRIVPREAIRWLRARDKKESSTEAGDAKLNQFTELARKTRIEADLKALELARLQGELVPTEVFTSFVTKFAGGFASVASGQLGRFERDMVAVATPADARLLRQKIQTALMEGAQRFADRLDMDAAAIEDVLAGAGSGDPDEDAADEDSSDSAPD